MKEHPIIFSPELVPKILDGTLTMTRRVIKPQPQPSDTHDWYWKPGGMLCSDGYFRERAPYHCPYGQVGDRLIVRETHYRWGRWVKNGLTETGKQAWTFKSLNRAVAYLDNPPQWLIETNKIRNTPGWFKRPSIHMPRWASRITLEITEVRVERLQEITAKDALAEGIEYKEADDKGFPICTPDVWFHILWDSLNAKRGYSWEVNPWVFVITFKVI